MAAVVDYPGIDVQLDRTYHGDGLRNAQGRYPGWDRHGRVKRHAWLDGALTQSGGLPTRPPILELTHTYDAVSNRESAMDARPRSGTAVTAAWSDFQYLYDDLDRLIEAKRGQWSGSGIGSTNRGVSQKWALELLGNWSSFTSDLDKDGTYPETGEEQTRSHDSANQLNSLDPDAGGSLPSLPFEYDASGTMRERATGSGAEVVYTHDAWNRLVRAEHVSTNPLITLSNPWLLTNRYNGLHWRVASTESSTGSSGTIDRAKTMVYSASWQVLQEEIDTNPSTSAGTDRISQTLWGARYIDDAVLRRVDTDLDGDEDQRFYYVTDAQFSVRALLDDASPPNLVERVSYTAYGEARHSWRGDINGDGATTLTDRNFIGSRLGDSIGNADYDPDCDMDRSGTIDMTDYNMWIADGFKSALPPGWISDPAGTDSRVGYCGYLFNTGGASYTVRFRHYEPTLGRWVERDHAGYLDGVNLYSYLSGSPVSGLDPLGLCECRPPDEDLPYVRPDGSLRSGHIRGPDGRIIDYVPGPDDEENYVWRFYARSMDDPGWPIFVGGERHDSLEDVVEHYRSRWSSRCDYVHLSSHGGGGINWPVFPGGPDLTPALMLQIERHRNDPCQFDEATRDMLSKADATLKDLAGIMAPGGNIEFFSCNSSSAQFGLFFEKLYLQPGQSVTTWKGKVMIPELPRVPGEPAPAKETRKKPYEQKEETNPCDDPCPNGTVEQ